MNYLGHAYLSFGDGDILTGNMAGDFVKGRLALDGYSPGIRKGIELHRKIDEFCDTHTATKRGKLYFREDYGLYSGAIIDTLYDHFLANDPKIFSTEQALLHFSQASYGALAGREAFFPAGFAQYFGYMVQHNWLYNYRTVKGMEHSLKGLQRRAKYMPPAEKAFEIFIGNFYSLNQCYFELIDDLIAFVKIELEK
ncbi:MAG: DUF479 domain-containing protein [Taibaiella sp.]|nr:DUF479 domain-containing protein [Taibaiella sp.]